MSVNKRVAIGVATGAVIGGIIAFTFNTKRGREVRDNLKDVTYDVAEDLIDLADAGVERAIDGWYKSQAAREDLSDIAHGKLEILKKRIGK